MPFLAWILEFSDQFLLFCVYRDHGLLLLLKRSHLPVDVLELSIAVGVRRTFPHLAVGLQAVTTLLQQHRHGTIRDRMVLLRQFLGQFGSALAGPTQRGHGIAARRGVDQPFQSLQQTRIRLRQFPASAARRSYPCRCNRSAFRRKLQFLQSRHDCRTRQARGSGHQRNPAPTNVTCFCRGPLPTPPLVQFDRDQTKLAANPCLDFCALHAQVIAFFAIFTNTNL
jgi:hypothetical protein